MKTESGPVNEMAAVKTPSKWGGMGPVFLSAVVFPGVGQLVQRRWVAGAGYAVAFGAAFSWLVVRFLGLLKIYYSLAFDFNREPGNAPSIGMVGWPFLVSMVIYLASLVDTAVGNHKTSQGTPAKARVP